MMTRYSVWLNKNGLSDIDPSIIVLDIAYNAPRMQTITAARAKMPGVMVTKRQMQYASVTVTFEIHETSVRRRQMVLQKIQQWAKNGGWLTTNDRPGQRLCVICDSMPTVTSALKWTEKMRLTFTAYERPYWEDEYAQRASVSGTSGNASIYIGGVADEAPVSVNVTNTSGAPINRLTLTVGETMFAFENLALQAGEVLEIGYDEHANLYMRAGGESRMDRRTGESSDDLLAACGAHTWCSVAADNAVSAAFMARGLYL